MTSFNDLGLSDNLLKSINEIGYTTPTPIQEKAIPFVFMNRDILASAQTGTGKTASFTLPMMDILSGGTTKPRMPRAIILEPTRELAVQVADNFDKYAKYTKLSKSLIIGGTSMINQEKEIEKGVDILIATPGRLLDIVNRGKVMLNDAKILVIDEADRMLDMGFIPDVETLVKIMPPMRQTIMFSATYPKSIQKLANKFLDNPKEIIVNPPSSTSSTIKQYMVKVDDEKEKYNTLVELLNIEKISNAIIFCNRKKDVATLYKKLENKGFKTGALHGDMEQSQRIEWLNKFKDNEITYLVCSDVAARGLDIPSVSHVFNMDIPMNAEDYVHRIGRTGRAGRSGRSFSFVTKRDKKLWQAVLDIIKKDVEQFTINTNKNQPNKENKKNNKHNYNSQQDIGEICEKQSQKALKEQNFIPAFLRK